MASDVPRARALDREGSGRGGFTPELPPVLEGVQESPVPRHEAQQAVEWKLNQRPLKQELIARNILSSIPASPALQSQAVRLQWEKKSNQLEQRIRRRPQLNDVVNLNILKDPKLSPGVQAAQDQIRRKNLAESLNNRIALRPGPLELIKDGILNPGDASILRALKSIPLAKKSSDDSEKGDPPEACPSPSPSSIDMSAELSSSNFVSDVIRRKSIQESAKTGALPSLGPYSSKRHSIGAAPSLDSVFQSPPPATGQLSLSMSMDETSCMEWESGEGRQGRKASESSLSSLPSPIDFSCLQADSPLGMRSPESVQRSASSPSATANGQPFSASLLYKKRGGVMSPRPQRKKSSSKSSKVRKYNFHEYKPPNHQGKIEKKPSTTTKPSGPYDYIVQQQQILLQIQLLQQQYPEQLSQISNSGDKDQQMTAIMKALGELSQQGGAGKKGDKSGRGTPKLDAHKSGLGGGAGGCSVVNGATTAASSAQMSPDTLVACDNGQKVKVEELKVNHLRSACKDRGLGVTGKKCELLERLLEHNRRKLPASVYAEVALDRRQSLSLGSGGVTPAAGGNGPAKPLRCDPAPSKQKLQAEQLQEKIKEICEQSKRVHLSGKSGTLYPAPVVEAMYNFDLQTPPSSTASVPQTPPPSWEAQALVASQPPKFSPLRNHSLPLSSELGKGPASDDLLQLISSRPSPPFQPSPAPAAKLSAASPPPQQVMSPTQDLLEQLKLSGAVSWSPDTATPPTTTNPLLTMSNGTYAGKFSDSSIGMGVSPGGLHQCSGLVRDTPLLASTASHPFQDQLLSTPAKSEGPYGCSSKETLEPLITSSTSQTLFDFLDLEQPTGLHSLYGSSPVGQQSGKTPHPLHAHLPVPSPMLGITVPTVKSGSDLYLPGHEYSAVQPSLPPLSRSPGSDQLEWLDLESSFGSQAPNSAGQGGGGGCLTDLQFGELGTFLDGVPSMGGNPREVPQYQPPDFHNDLGFGSLGNSNFVDNSDIFQPATSEQSFVEIGMSH
uniref:MRTF n=1 Tax=Halisarca dujardinii TaxID=2583056 RepID=A0AAU8KYC4_HALDU